QAEDGILDRNVTGVQTCALPIYFIKIRRQRSLGLRARAKIGGQLAVALVFCILALQFRNENGLTPASTHLSFVRDITELGLGSEIGRAACRERGSTWGGV